MSNELFPSGPSGQSEQTSTAATQAVEPQQGAGTDTGSSNFTQEQVEQLLKDRLAKAERKFAKRQAEYEAQLSAYKKNPGAADSPNTTKAAMDADFRQRMAQWDTEKKSLTEKLNNYRSESLKVKVQKSLMDNDCLDPDLVFTDLVSKGFISLDEDDEIALPVGYDSLDSMVKNYLSGKEYLVRAKRAGGVGSKAPINATPVTGGDAKSQLLAAIQAVQPNQKTLFRR